MKSYRLASRLVGVLMVGVVLWLTACPAPSTPTPAAPPTALAPTVAPPPGAVATPTPRPTPPPPAVVKPTGELRIALPYLAAEALDPILTPGGAKYYLSTFYDSLVGVTPDGQLSTETGIAQKWEVSADKKTWTFTLRKGVKFHNGDELTSEDVKFSIERFMLPKSIATNVSSLRANIDRIETPEPYKVVIHAKGPYGFMDGLLSMLVGHNEGMVMPKKYIQEKGEDNFNRNPMGSGVYKFKEQVIGSYMLFEAQDSHWSGVVPKFKRLMFFIVPEEVTRIAMLKTGQADIVDVSREKIKELSAYSIFQKEAIISVTLWMDRQWDPANPLSDKRLREALNLAINRQELLEHLFIGQGTLHSGDMLFSPFALGYKPVPPYPFDPERAKKLVSEAFPGGITLDFYSYARPGVPELGRMNEAVSSYLGKIGVKTKIIPTDYPAYRSLKTKGPANAIAGMATETGRPLLGPVWRTLWYSNGLISMARDPTLDGMLDALDRAIDPQGVGELHVKIANYLRDNHMAGGILFTGSPYAADPKKVKGWDLGKVSFDLNVVRGIR